jgi:methionyl-tRNA formyltransferase
MTRDRLVFFGTDAFSVPTLIRLVAEGYNVVAVVTKPDSRAGRGRELSPPAVKRLAEAQRIPVLQPTRVSDIEADLEALHPDSGIVVAYGKIIPPAVLELFPKGLINIHASILPRYRGASPIEAAILNGEEATGVTLMRLDNGVDTGPTYDVAKLQLTGTETRPELYEQLAEIGSELLSTKLVAILDGNIVPIPQDNTQASTVGMLRKQDGVIDWTKPAEQLDREIRAYLLWPGSRAHIDGTDAIITAAHIHQPSGPPGQAFKTASSELAVYAGTGSLIIDRLKPVGKREMTGLEFLAGHPLR